MDAEEEITALTREIDHVIRDGSLDRRRAMMIKLLDLCKSPKHQIRQYSVVQLDRWFLDFPDLQEACIDSLYDLCEDPVSEARLAAYRQVPSFSRKNAALVKRNVDVLVQLLQNEEPVELKTIQQSLREHYSTNATATCQVLFDSCMPSPEATEDERAHRGHLRELVISFLLDPDTVRMFLLSSSSPQTSSDQVVDGLLKILPSTSPQRMVDILRKLALNLPTFKKSSDRGDALLKLLTEKANQTIETESRKRTSETMAFGKVEALLTLCREVVFTKELAKPNALFQFYCQQLEKRPNAFTRKYSVDMLKALGIMRRQNPEGLKDLDAQRQREMIRRSPAIVKLLLQPSPPSWEELESLVVAISDRSKETDFVFGSDLVNSLNSIVAASVAGAGGSRTGETPAKARVESLAKELLERPRPAREGPKPLSFRNAAQLHHVGGPKRKHSGEEQRSPIDQSGVPSLASRLGQGAAAAQETRRQSDRGQPPAKRWKEEEPGVGRSLLSRIQGMGVGDVSRGGDDGHVGEGASTGFSIKGAAAADSRPRPPSLQARLGEGRG